VCPCPKRAQTSAFFIVHFPVEFGKKISLAPVAASEASTFPIVLPSPVLQDQVPSPDGHFWAGPRRWTVQLRNRRGRPTMAGLCISPPSPIHPPTLVPTSSTPLLRPAIFLQKRKNFVDSPISAFYIIQNVKAVIRYLWLAPATKSMKSRRHECSAEVPMVSGSQGTDRVQRVWEWEIMQDRVTRFLRTGLRVGYGLMIVGGRRNALGVFGSVSAVTLQSPGQRCFTSVSVKVRQGV
jgi:hypothetical protein